MGHQADNSIGKNLMQSFKNFQSLVSSLFCDNRQPSTVNRQLKRGPPGKEAPLRKSQPLIIIFMYVDAIFMAKL